ncbi:glycoside hydrolase [Bacillus sp. BRMEA1]|uniref:GH25 family lysozyme n=1 Tax=Neobacillus endophyticus TaxID=2738405 RepID=UPI0015654E8B|nr:GH25 family lysozyme [Neobacillus endophyticus]NRD80259.1 glycoside hydrolase [Neobacillus endophyticus]
MLQIKGIDVYQGDGPVDWAKVKADGAKFAFIKATQGIAYKYVDYFRNNAPKALGAGLDVGAYHYATFSTVPEALTQAKYFESVIKDFKLTYPVALDLEENKAKVSKKQLTDAAIAFIEYLENKGYFVMLYTYDSFLDEQLEKERLTNYAPWIARYQGQLKNHADIWQYTETGTVEGIAGKVDMNWSYRDFAAEIAAKNKPAAEIKSLSGQIGVITVTTNTVIRKGPNPAYDIVNSVKVGDTFKCYGYQDGWYNVGSGWIKAEYVTFKKI